MPSNISEGQARQHRKEFRQFLHVALGSLAELDTQLTIAERLGYLEAEEWKRVSEQMLGERKMIFGLPARLRSS